MTPKQIWAALFYAGSSLLIMFSNKILLTVYAFPSFNFLALCQFTATIAILSTLKGTGKISFPEISIKSIHKVLPLPIVFMLNVMCGLGGTKAVSLPMFTALRRFSVLMTLILESVLLGSTASNSTKFSIGLMIAGAMVAASSDLAFDAWGYTLILFNDVFTAMFGVILKKKSDAKDLNSFGLLFFNSLCSIPFMLAVIILTGSDIQALRDYPHWGDTGFRFIFLSSTVMGAILNYSIFVCTSNNSALTTTVVGCLKNLLTSYSGMLGVGGDYIFSWNNFVGLNIAMVGALYYAKLKLGAKSEPQKVVEAEKPRELADVAVDKEEP